MHTSSQRSRIERRASAVGNRIAKRDDRAFGRSASSRLSPSATRAPSSSFRTRVAFRAADVSATVADRATSRPHRVLARPNVGSWNVQADREILLRQHGHRQT